MTPITLVPQTSIDSFITQASKDIVIPYVPLQEVHDNLLGDNPIYAWHHLKVTNRHELWVIGRLDTHEPVPVSHIGVVHEAATRAHGTYVPEFEKIPPEYPTDRISHQCDFTTKLFWSFVSKRGHPGQLGTLMREIEQPLHQILEGAFDTTDTSVPQLRSSWNVPDKSERYLIEHPVVSHPAAANRRGAETDGATLHPWITSGLEKYKETCQSTGKTWMELVEVPGRPAVLARRGSYHDESASPVICEEEDDWHREGDILWFGGTIYCVVNKSDGKYKGWSVEWWPDSVVRIAKLKLPPRKRRACMELKATPGKRICIDPKQFPTPSKTAYMPRVEASLFLDDSSTDSVDGSATSASESPHKLLSMVDLDADEAMSDDSDEQVPSSQSDSEPVVTSGTAKGRGRTRRR